jgi:hypothetical protein
MATFEQTAHYIRSKNAGPFWLTIDIFCSDEKDFDKFKASKNCTSQVFAKVFQVDSEKVKIFFLKSLFTIKISLPRPMIQGHAYERDMHCGQQYVQLLDLEL